MRLAHFALVAALALGCMPLAACGEAGNGIASAGSAAVATALDPASYDKADSAIAALAVVVTTFALAGLVSPAVAAKAAVFLDRAREAVGLARTAIAIKDAPTAAAKLEEVGELVSQADALIHPVAAAAPDRTVSPGA